MPTNDLSPKTEAEPYSLQVHRKENFWKILFPVLLSAAVMVTALLLIILFQNRFAAGVAGPGAAAAVLVILPQLLLLLIPLAITAGLAYAVMALKKKIPGQGKKIIEVLRAIQVKTHQVSNAAAKPSIKASSFMAQVRQLVMSLDRRLR